MNHKNRGKRLKLIPAFAVLFFAGAASPLHAAEKPIIIRSEVATDSDLLSLPPVCKLIIVEKPNAHHPAARGEPEYVALFQRPGYEMGANNGHLHHYCWALIHKKRYFRAHGTTLRNQYFQQFMGDIDYVLTNTEKDGTNWPYFHVLLIEQGEMLLIRGDYPGSLAKADEALKRKPDADKAYALKFNIYMAMGDKKKAIDVAQDGLKKAPDSNILRKRLESVGVKVPAAIESTNGNGETGATLQKAELNPDTPASDKKINLIIGNNPDKQSAETDVKEPESEPSPNLSDIENSAQKHPNKPATDTETPPPKSYCRFCP